jgi:hypothetical protein
MWRHVKNLVMHVGQRVYYRDAQGGRRRAVIQRIHHDQHPPYYTLRLLQDRREIQTEATRIIVRQRDLQVHHPLPV